MHKSFLSETLAEKSIGWRWEVRSDRSYLTIIGFCEDETIQVSTQGAHVDGRCVHDICYGPEVMHSVRSNHSNLQFTSVDEMKSNVKIDEKNTNYL